MYVTVIARQMWDVFGTQCIRHMMHMRRALNTHSIHYAYVIGSL